MKLDSEVTKKIKFLYNKQIITQALFYEDDTYEEEAIISYIEYTHCFYQLCQEFGFDQAILLFDENELNGTKIIDREVVGTIEELEAVKKSYYVYKFYEKAIKDLPINAIDKMKDLVDKMQIHLDEYTIKMSKYFGYKEVNLITGKLYGDMI